MTLIVLQAYEGLCSWSAYWLTCILTYPDGHQYIILHVPKYDFNWQFSYANFDPAKNVKYLGGDDDRLAHLCNPSARLDSRSSKGRRIIGSIFKK